MKPGEGGRFHSLTFAPGAGLLREIPSPVGICAAHDSNAPQEPAPKISMFTGIWDTGATNTLVTQNVVDTCGLKQSGIAELHGVGIVEIKPTYLIDMQLYNGPTVENLVAALGEFAGGDVLIGMDVITLGDFAITNKGGNTVFSFRIPSRETIDYVKQTRQENLVKAGHRSRMSVNPATRGRGKKR